MIAGERNELAQVAWQTCLENLPPELRAALSPPKGDPQPHPTIKNVARLRVLPRRKLPPTFWSSTSCFFEITIGIRSTTALVHGTVAFFQYPNKKACGSGRYYRPTIEILRSAEGRRPEFHLDPTGGEKGAYIIFERGYAVKEFSAFPAVHAGEDLAWLITETLPRIQALNAM